MTKPNCYDCRHRGRVAGSAHSSCHHPHNEGDLDNKMASLMAMLGMASGASDGHRKLGITARAHGIRKGWFNYPFDFDPVWLETCNGFEANEEK